MEQRITTMSSQLLGATPTNFEQQRKEYAAKVADLERERQLIEEDKLQVDRYKKLLLKQRYLFCVYCD
jgi:hypothetical protein